MRECIKNVTLSLMMILTIVACSRNEDITPPTLSLLAEDGSSLNNASIHFDGGGEEKSVQIRSNSQWQIECAAEWVDFSPLGCYRCYPQADCRDYYLDGHRDALVGCLGVWGIELY